MRQLTSAQSLLAEAVGEGAGGQRRQLAQRPDAEPLQRRCQLGPERRGEERHGQRREESPFGAGRDDLRPASGARAARGGVGAEAARGRAPAGGDRHRPARAGEHALHVPAVQAAQGGGVEVRLARRRRLDRGPDPLQPGQHRLPCARRALRVGRDQPQARAARERLADPHPGVDAERLRGPRDLSHDLRPVWLRRQRERLPQQLAPGAHRRQQLESGDEDADDHNRTYVRMSASRAKSTASRQADHLHSRDRLAAEMGGGSPRICTVAVLAALVVALLAFAGTAGAATTNTNISSFSDPRGDLPNHPGQLVRSTYGTFTIPANGRAPQRPDDRCDAPCTQLPDHGHGAEPRVHERLHGEHAGRAAAAPLRDLQPGAAGHRLPDQRAVLRRRQRAHAPAPAVALRLPQHERDLEHDHAPREHRATCRRRSTSRSSTASGRWPETESARPRGSTSTRSAPAGTRSTRSRPATPTRTATGPCRRTRACSACRVTCTTSTSSTRTRARCTAPRAVRRSRSARSCVGGDGNDYFGPIPPNNPPPADITGATLCRSEAYHGTAVGTDAAGERAHGHDEPCAGSSARCRQVRRRRHTRPTAPTRSRAIRSRPVR